jgi:hypothetical protein
VPSLSVVGGSLTTTLGELFDLDQNKRFFFRRNKKIVYILSLVVDCMVSG